MGLQEALKLLQHCNDAGQKLTVGQLENLLLSMSTKVKGSRISLVYSDTIDPPGADKIAAWEAAESMGKGNSRIATLGKTDISKLIKSDEFKKSLRLSTDENQEAMNRILNGTTDPVTGQRLQPGLWDKISEKYVMNIKGPV